MIYEFPGKNHPIRQGDIFYPLPRMLIDLSKLPIQSGERFEENNWQVVKDRENIVVSVPLKPVWGIIATQDCDTLRGPVISLFEIETLEKVTKMSLPASTKKWADFVTQKSRLYARWFYLPVDSGVGFQERMAINFEVVFQIRRENLEHYITELRRGRLNEIAFQHYRESIAQYFRRYPYDEWYPLTKEEFTEYNKDKGPVEPFDWQG